MKRRPAGRKPARDDDDDDGRYDDDDDRRHARDDEECDEEDNNDRGRDDRRMRDDARADDRIAGLESQIEQLTRSLNRPLEERANFAKIQAKADDVYQAHGKKAPQDLTGETITAYRLRLVREMQPHSPSWKDRNLATLAAADATILDTAEDLIYADATAAAQQLTAMPGQLRKHRRVDPDTHQTIYEWHGDPNAWMNHYKAPYQLATRIGTVNKEG